ncbi:unnamed protein product [Owenia fusiformis]|uniref:Replication factor C subunit 2 n=1 Tax=Owenia fusiformis TaxID=6347 RepID=A0A8J1Y802_OWEFU|nr:unnamed protein product [Owenia fusiformis]
MHAFFKPTGTKSSVGANVTKDVTAGTSGKSKAKRPRQVPWVEKYRPKNLEEVAHQEEVVNVLKKSLQGSDLPNLLFYGPPGTGKTSTILAAAKELFGPVLFKERVLELNSSDERGINVIREKVKTFAQQTASSFRSDGKSCPPFKIIILDEADSMTKPAQAALRRTMEKESRMTRFCLICNYVSRIIEPITSRCAKFRFKPLDETILKTRLREICEGENVKCEDEAIEALLATSEGDMRKAITFLQSAARLHPEDEITKSDIYEIAGVISDEEIDGVLNTCFSDSYEKLEAVVKDVMLNGHSGAQIINQMHDKLITMDTLSDKQKAAILERLAVVDKRLLDGADEYLQIMDLCTVIMHQICHNQK